MINRYRKVRKFWEARNGCSNLPKIQTKRPNLKGNLSKCANGIANSEDPDHHQSLIWVCTICSELSVLTVITVVFCISIIS